MIDQNLVRLIAEAGELTGADHALEVGPGTGTLTEELLTRAARVTACEIDRDLSALLRDRYAGEAKFTLVEGDVLAGKHALAEAVVASLSDARDAGLVNKLVANLPYNIASPLVVELLLAGVELLAFTVQKEVADRLRASPGGKDYGPLTVTVQLLGRVEVLRTISPGAFWPPPKIDSALVRIRRDDRLGTRARDVSRFVQQLFSMRRKTLRRALSSAVPDVEADAALAKAGLNPTDRPETASPEALLRLWGFTAGRPGRA